MIRVAAEDRPEIESRLTITSTKFIPVQVETQRQGSEQWMFVKQERAAQRQRGVDLYRNV